MSSVLFGIDAASFQGSVVWSKVADTCSFGFEKVTQGTGYVNPYWIESKNQLLTLAATGKFVPGAYLFLEQGNGEAQANFFASKAGSLDGWLVAVDAEPSKASSPTEADLTAAVDKLRLLYPNSLIGGYCPRWYWGDKLLTQFDWIWASKYVNGSDTPERLYAKVPSSSWENYGGRTVELLQFTSSSLVPGVSGAVDASAFRGDILQLKELTTKPQPKPVTPTNGDSMYVFDQPKNKQVVLPVASSSTQILLYAAEEPSATPAKLHIVCGPGEQRIDADPRWTRPATVTLPKGTTEVALSRIDSGDAPVTVLFR